MFNLFSFSKIICSLKTNSLIGEWQGLTGRDELLCSCSTVNTLEKNLPNSSALSLFESLLAEHSIFRPHIIHSIDDGVVCTVRLCVGHDHQPCKNGGTDQDAFWGPDSHGPNEPGLSRSRMGRSTFGGRIDPLKSIRRCSLVEE